MKKFLIFILKISISIGLLVFLFSRIDLEKTFSSIRTVDPFYFILAAILFVLIIILGIMRWIILLRVINKDVPLGRICIAHCGGLFFNTCLPSAIGGDVARTVDLSLHTKDAPSVLASVFLDRLGGFVGLVLISLFGFFYGYVFGFTSDLRLLAFITLLAAVTFFTISILFSSRIFKIFHKLIFFKVLQDFFTKFHRNCYKFRSQKKALIKVVLISVLLQGGFSVAMYLLGLSLGIRFNLYTHSKYNIHTANFYRGIRIA
ncbi:YbhN family protein [Thermoproteota archaeon]